MTSAVFDLALAIIKLCTHEWFVTLSFPQPTWKLLYKPDETDLTYQMVQDLLHSQIVSGSIKHSPSEAEPRHIRDVHFCDGQLVSKRRKSSNGHFCFPLYACFYRDSWSNWTSAMCKVHLTTNYTWSFTEEQLVATLHKWTLHLLLVHIPQSEHPWARRAKCCSVWGMLLDVTPSNPMPHPLPSQTTHSTSCYLRSKIWLLSNIQQSLLLVTWKISGYQVLDPIYHLKLKIA